MLGTMLKLLSGLLGLAGIPIEVYHTFVGFTMVLCAMYNKGGSALVPKNISSFPESGKTTSEVRVCEGF